MSKLCYTFAQNTSPKNWNIFHWMIFFVGSSLSQLKQAKLKGAMQTILLVSVVCVASGFTLEMPELPDLIGTVGKVFGGNFTLKMVEEPKVFLPKVSQIESMTREDSMEASIGSFASTY